MAPLAANRFGDPARRRLWAAVLLSLLVHASLLPWDIGVAYRQVVLPRSLSVQIVHPSPAPLPVVVEPEPIAPLTDKPVPAVQKAEPEIQPLPLPDYHTDAEPENQQEEIIQPAEPASAEEQRRPDVPAVTVLPDENAIRPASASEVAVLLLIDVNGEVLQIVWDKLPAISYETLDRMEMQLREKRYPPSEKPHTLTVVVAVPQ